MSVLTINSIEAKTPRECNKITKEELLNVILEHPDSLVPLMDIFNELSNKVEGLVNTCSFFQSQAVDNAANIHNLEKSNESLTLVNKSLKIKMDEMNEGINAINSYFRVDNIEAVGLPAPNEGESDADILLECLNLLPLDPLK